MSPQANSDFLRDNITRDSDFMNQVPRNCSRRHPPPDQDQEDIITIVHKSPPGILVSIIALLLVLSTRFVDYCVCRAVTT